MKHLRLHFSLLLMPVYLFALSQTTSICWRDAILTFIILHILVYPASHVFNSYYDNDIGSVGGLHDPPPKNAKMLPLANLLDLTAIVLSLYINYLFTGLIVTYILMSRLYSYKPIRLKQYAVIGFLIIFIFQGGFTYYLSKLGVTGYANGCFQSLKMPQEFNLYSLLACSFQIGAIYPLTQIYQHQSDLADGVKTISFKLGYKGTFFFSGLMFSLATLFYYLYFKDNQIHSFYILVFAQLPIIAYFLYWFKLVWNDQSYANYKHTMRMSTISAIILNLFFLYLVINR